MKNILYSLLITGLFLSFKSNTKQIVKNTVKVKPTDHTQDLIKKFKPIIQGVWVKKDYVAKVIKTKSPLAAADECRGITTMYINTDHIKGDSIVFMAGYFNHDGANVIIKFRPGKSPSTILFNGKDLSYSIENGDTTITVSQYDEKGSQFIKAKYIKVLNKQPDDDLGYGMNYIINKGLVAGKYVFTDATGSTSKVNFSNYGKISGFSNFTKYEINIDLNSDPMDNLDEIGFDYDKKNHASYSYKITADTLNLYATHPNSDSTELVLGKLVYKLVRQK